MSLHTCYRAGRVVSAMLPIPQATFDRDFGGPKVGCSHLKCSQCGQPVRQQAGLSWGATAAQLAASDDWSALADRGALERDPDHRLYACTCRVHVEDSDRTLLDGDDWDHDELPPPWRCAGHPGLTLPTTLDGVALGDVAQVIAQLVAHPGSAPPAAPAFTQDYPSAWLHRLVHLLDPRPSDLLDALVAHLAHPDAAVRAAVLDLYRRTPTLAGGEHISAALLEHPERFEGVANPLNHDESLHLWGQIAVARRALWTDPLGSPLDEVARDALQPLALRPIAPAQSLLSALALIEPEWLARNAAPILANTPSRDVARDVLYALRRQGQPGIDAATAMQPVFPGQADDYRDLVRQLVPAAVPDLR